MGRITTVYPANHRTTYTPHWIGSILRLQVAALVGTLRTIKRWSLTAIIFGSTLAPLMLTFMLQFSPAVEVAGMAWDSGAVTTGCVTVPLVLALGVG